ncbi:MAG: hypothetical protein JWL77_6229 [Chthonomonadaceae bacterium]|nr:hypothetical protein [Chthonomonadaceae bacterium]
MNPNSQTTQNLFAVLAISLAMGTALDCLAMRPVSHRPAAGTHQKRKEFIGHADPKGYRCRFTLSSDWQSEDERDLRHGPVEGQIDKAVLFPKRVRVAEISLQTFRKTMLPRDVPILHGYPEPVGWGKDRLITHRHLRIDGCPATMVRAYWVEGGQRYRETEFYVYVPSRSILYLTHTFSEPAEYERADREMQAIIGTFHVERGVPTTRRKR